MEKVEYISKSSSCIGVLIGKAKKLLSVGDDEGR
jgi:hypothetical protein